MHVHEDVAMPSEADLDARLSNCVGSGSNTNDLGSGGLRLVRITAH